MEKEAAAKTEASVEEPKEETVEATPVEEEVTEETELVSDNILADEAKEETPHRRSKPMIIITCAVIAVIVLAATVITQKFTEKRGPRKKK